MKRSARHLNTHPSSPRRTAHWLKTLLGISCLALLSNMSFALPEDSQKAIEISANAASLDRQTGTATYDGNVILVQGTLKITADKIVIRSKKDNSLDKIIATGVPAHYQQQPKVNESLTHAQGQQIIYDTQKGLLTLTHDAKIKQPGHGVINGEKIIYDIAKQSVKAGPTSKKSSSKTKPSRVHIKIQPPKKNTNNP